ncbi:ABC transporter ATP-binding protein [Pseudonocardia sp. C8]|uniref:ABC transporter ATP-binding protein n=1 Tax=Pseudonocardia sp. C8 TaxID=2762759 RepID=UPI001642BC61|nr:ABC transporter ATP-binding protein [Pseudonocardia sp. C8]MBC3191568.1 ABC transporter ATP-binding protein [Pseudonocardia sp. C8]
MAADRVPDGPGGDRDTEITRDTAFADEHAGPARGAPPAADDPAHALAGVAPEPGVAKPDPVLVADDVTRTFGGLTAVDVTHLEFQRGAITGLIGPNGAGKTTLFNLLTGFDRADTGTWVYEGAPLQKLPPHRVARLGVVRTFQLTKALAGMTVMDNMRLGATGQRGESFMGALFTAWGAQERQVTERARELLARFQLEAKADDLAGSLSGGQRKLLEMARALMMEPKVVMLDEPMAGVNPALTQSLLRHVKSLRDEGMSVVFVEHDMDVIRDISDWVVVMAQGQVIAEGPPSALSSNPAVVDAYLGAHHDRLLEFDAEGNPVGETAALVAEMEAAEQEADEGKRT